MIGIGEVTAGVDPITGRPEIGTWWIAYGDTTDVPACVVLITQDSLGVRKDSEWSLSKITYAKLANDLEEVGLFDIIRYDATQKKQKVFNRNRWLSVRIGDRIWGYGGRPPSHFQALNTSATLLENQVFDSATTLVDVAFKNATFVRELTQDQSRALPAMKLLTSSALDRKNFHWPKTR